MTWETVDIMADVLYQLFFIAMMYKIVTMHEDIKKLKAEIWRLKDDRDKQAA